MPQETLKPRMIWAVCEVCGGNTGDVQFVRETRQEAMSSVSNFPKGTMRIVKFVEVKRRGRK